MESTLSGPPPPGADDGVLSTYLKKLCSDVTLQSKKDGFFSQWVEHVKKNITPSLLQEFTASRKDFDRIKTVWEWPFVHSLGIERFYTHKNEEVSEARREEGNKAYQAGKDEMALQLYSQSVVRGSLSGKNLSLSYANRSAVLLRMKKYSLCLQDIALALEHNYPEKLRYKILDRRGQCLECQGLYRDAKMSYEESLQALALHSSTQGKKILQFKNNIFKSIERINENLRQPLAIENVYKWDKKSQEGMRERMEKREALPFDGPSVVLPNASARISIQHTQKHGRFVVANDDIPADKVVVREKPFSSVLQPERNGLHCCYCFLKLASILIPCPNCSNVAFCSVSCRTKALDSYHQWECPYQDLLKASGMSLNSYLALRTFTEKGLPYYLDSFESINESSLLLPSAKSPHRPEDYKYFYHLASLEDMREPLDFLQRTLMATFLLKILIDSGFFDKNQDKIQDWSKRSLKNDESLIGSLILRHLQIIQFNAHEVSGFMAHENGFKESKSLFLGLAIYPTVSFFNHSCYPGVGRYFDGKEMTIVTLRPVRKGEQICENYGPIFTNSIRKDRQRKMKSRYWFDCRCDPCIEDWPIYSQMNARSISLRCPHCRQKLKARKSKSGEEDSIQPEADFICVNCDLRTNPQQQMNKINFARSDYENALLMMDSMKREEAISCFAKYVDSVEPLIWPPLEELHLSLQALRLLVCARGTTCSLNL